MQKIKRAIFATAVAMSTTNCSSAKFDSVEGFAKLDLPSQLQTEARAVNLDVVAKACTSGNTEYETVRVSFADPTPMNGGRCSWGVNGDESFTVDQDPLTEDRMNARHEQDMSFQLPANAKICDMKLNFEKQRFVYDDEFFLIFDDAVLAASNRVVTNLTQTDGIYSYDWSRLTKKQTPFKETFRYCLGTAQTGSTTCSWPLTEEEGTIQMVFQSQDMQRITAKNLNRASHNFKFVTTGDNNLEDCRHTPVSFDVLISYSKD